MRRTFLAEALPVVTVAVAAALLARQARYWPEMGYDESAAWLGVRIFRDLSFGPRILPRQLGDAAACSCSHAGFGFARARSYLEGDVGAMLEPLAKKLNGRPAPT